jgi:exopolysaccharide biosynthesis polyprenyl glycosylphosphotransferase
MKNGISLIYTGLLILADSLALIAAFAAAWFMRIHWTDKPFMQGISGEAYLGVFITLLPFWILTFAFLGLYSNNIYEKRFSEFSRLLVGTFIGLLFVVFWEYVTVQPIFPAKMIPIYGFVVGFLLILLFRTIIRGFRTLLFRFNIGITNILVIGNNPIAAELVATLQNSHLSGYRIISVIGDKRKTDLSPDFSSFEEAINGLGNEYPLHGVLQTELYANEDKNREILDYAQTHHISYRFVPGNSELFVGNLEVDLFRSAIPVIAVHQTALFGWGRIVKRVFDVLFGGFMFIILSPLMLLIALGVKLSDPKGPVFMRGKQQGRLTRFNRVFKVYKFRSHYAKFDGKTDEEVFTMIGKPELITEYRKNGDKLDNDFRVTPFGKFIRSFSLDELPQLINVVKGDISLVGPRALVPHELESFGKKHTILSVKSGLTGLAVVSGRRNISFEERRKLDLYYVQNWSFWLDITILFKTVRVILAREGAK